MAINPETDKLKPRCPVCGSRMVHIRVGTQEIVCNRCGRINKLDASPEEIDDSITQVVEQEDQDQTGQQDG